MTNRNLCLKVKASRYIRLERRYIVKAEEKRSGGVAEKSPHTGPPVQDMNVVKNAVQKGLRETNEIYVYVDGAILTRQG